MEKCFPPLLKVQKNIYKEHLIFSYKTSKYKNLKTFLKAERDGENFVKWPLKIKNN